MKRVTVVVLLLSIALAAKDSKNPADYPLTAHVLSANGGTAWATSEASMPWTVRFQIGNLIYTTGNTCRRHVTVGTDVHARIQKRTIYVLTDDGATCNADIHGVQEK